jgi:PAS domain S-box-containing protein
MTTVSSFGLVEPTFASQIMGSVLQLVNDMVGRRGGAASLQAIPRIESRAAYLRRLALLWIWGVIALGLVTLVCFKLGLDESTAKCAFLTAIVFLSLMDSVISSLVFCAVATLYIDYFFTQPIFAFHLPYSADLPSLISFVVASLVITALVRYIRIISDVRRDQARLLDLSRDTLIVRDMDGVITYWNRGAADLYGWTSKEAVGQIAHTLLRTRFPTSIEEINATLLRTGNWEGELVHTRRDGAEVVMSSRWCLQCDEIGRPLASLENGNDIGARKRAEEALWRCQATYLAEAQNLSLTGSFGWNVGSGEVHWSDQTFRLFEYDPDVIPTLNLVFQRVHPDDRARVRQTLDQMTRGAQEFDFEHRLLMPDGRVKFVHVVARALPAETNHRQYIGAVMDVTSAKSAEAQLHDAQNELARVARATTLGALSASIAHEVNQPLAAIVNDGAAGLRWLNRTPPDTGEASTCLEHVVANAQRAANIIQRIRSLTTKGAAQTAPLGLNDVVNDVVSLTQREVASHRVSMHVSLAPSLPPLLGDRVQLQQVLINLIVNGIQSMDTVNDWPRELSIESRRDEDGSVTVAVRDSGVGISPEDKDRLFEGFFSTKPQGMGMGLSICRSIIEAHGGRICACNNDGHGATFQCTLPPIAATPGAVTDQMQTRAGDQT